MTAVTILVTFLLLFAVLVAVTFGGFLANRRMTFLEAEYHRIRLAAVEDGQLAERLFSELSARLDSAERRIADSQQHSHQSVNYSQRSQMLRMIRRGDAAEQIANALGVAVSQVRLLMKLPGVVSGSAKEKGHGAGQ